MREKTETHIHPEPELGEDGGGRAVAGDVAVELLAVAVPLDAIQPVPLHVVLALQHHVLPPDGVGGQLPLGQSYTLNTCSVRGV